MGRTHCYCQFGSLESSKQRGQACFQSLCDLVDDAYTSVAFTNADAEISQARSWEHSTLRAWLARNAQKPLTLRTSQDEDAGVSFWVETSYAAADLPCVQNTGGCTIKSEPLNTAMGTARELTTAGQIDIWRTAASENQNLEFKEAKLQYDNETLFQYCVAIANEGGGHLLLGVGNKPPRHVVGTNAFQDPVKMEEKLFQTLGFRVDIDEVTHPDGRVLVFKIPSRPRGTA